MMRFRAWLVLAVLALWLPATSHAMLEQAGWIHVEEHHERLPGTEHHHEHDAADGTCRIAADEVQIPQPASVATTLPGMDCEPGPAGPTPKRCAVLEGPSPPGTSPPEIARSWQFAWRTVAPTRAPSFVS